MPNFTITLERTVTIRETGEIAITADDLGQAERLARERILLGLTSVRWRSDLTDAGRVVVVDAEERSNAA